MRPSVLTNVIAARANAHFDGTKMRPVFIQGEPGIGKTQMFQQIAAKLAADRGQEVGYMQLHAPLMLPEDFGMPNFVDGRLEFAVPESKFPFEGTNCPEVGILNFDEVAQMGNDQQKIAANLYQERDLHGRKLKPGWLLVGTGNRMQDRAGAGRLLSHFNSRFTTYDMEANLDDWVQWCLERNLPVEVIAFCQFSTGDFATFDPNAPKCPSPRAWVEGVAPSLEVIPSEGMLDTVAGDVGAAAAARFMAFLKTFRELPDPDLVLAQADTHPVPTELQIRFALCGAIAYRASEDNMDRVVTFANRLPDEFMILLIKNAITMHPEVKQTSAYMKWTTGRGAQALLNL